MNKLLFLFTLLITITSCAEPKEKVHLADEVQLERSSSNFKKAYFASGCFWCVEAVFESVKGVKEAVSGYSGGVIENPTYEQICTGKLRHAEAVEVIYDPEIVSYATLVDVFFNSHDPSTLNQQGPDIGPQYRSIAFFQNDNEKEIIISKIDQLLNSNEYETITTEVTVFEVFYDAEEYHQDYEKRNPNNSYVRAVSIPRLNKFKNKMPDVLK